MKPLLTTLIFLFMAITAIGQQDYPDSGFTNKAEAKNLMVNGMKDDKWIEYYNAIEHLGSYEEIKAKDTSAQFYALMVYKDGAPYGIERDYDKFDKHMKLTHYLNGKKNDVEYIYYESGKLHIETHYTNGVKNGVEKIHIESGGLWSETPYINGKKDGLEVCYFVTGKLRSETPYTGGLRNGTQKIYQEDGKTLYVEITFVNDKWNSSKTYDGKGNVIQKNK